MLRSTEPPLPRLHFVAADEVVGAADFRERVLSLAEAGGASLAIQIRIRDAPARRTYEVARWLVDVATEAGATIIVSDRLDVALATGANGVHLREDSMPVPVARTVARTVRREVAGSLVVGRSIHAPSQAAEPWAAEADYLIFGSVWATGSHPGCAPAGPEALAEAAGRTRTPVLAIGGVTPETTAAAVSSGAYGIVVRSGIWAAARPAEAVTRYLEALAAAHSVARADSPVSRRNPAGNGGEE